MSVAAAAARDINHIYLLTRKDMLLSKLELSFSLHFSDEQVQRWFLTNSIWVETLLAVVSVGIWIVALPIIIFGTFTALGGDTSILDIGTIIVVAGFLIITLLAVYAVVSAILEIRHQGLFFDQMHDGASIAHAGIQFFKTLIAGVLLISLFIWIISALTATATSTAIPGLSNTSVSGSASALRMVFRWNLSLLAASGFLLPVTVLIHAFGALVLTIFRTVIGIDG